MKYGRLDWAAAIPIDKSELVRALILARRVRNDLFHGGKYNPQTHEETERNERLLRATLDTLYGCLEMSPQLANAYNGTAI
jgi:hypothetical protein